MLVTIASDRRRPVWLAVCTLIIGLGLEVQPSWAQAPRAQRIDLSTIQPQDIFNEPSAPLTVGTTITAQNWYQYRGAFALTMQAMFSGVSAITTPPPGWSLVIEPHRPVPMPKAYRADTERYASQVKLKELADGGYVPTGYVAGLPFPNPSGPTAGAQWMYNIYYDYRPYLLARDNVDTIKVDKFGNVAPSIAIQIGYKLLHISDPGIGHSWPGGPDNYYVAQYTETYTPEQAKYSASLAYFPDNPAEANELYFFVPALRRSLRGSQRARCAPYLGADFTVDDLNSGFNGIPSEFYAKVLGEKQMLYRMHLKAPYYRDPHNFNTVQGNWPIAKIGGWEPRDIVLLDITPIDSALPGYCYSHRLLYIDKESGIGLAADMWDSNDKYWRGSAGGGSDPFVIPNSGGDVEIAGFGNIMGAIYDFQGIHGTLTVTTEPVYVNTEAPHKYFNLSRYASPAGLAKVMQ